MSGKTNRQSLIESEGNPLAKKGEVGVVHVKVENLSEARLIKRHELDELIELLAGLETNEEVLSLVELHKAPFLFHSAGLIQMLTVTTSVRTKVGIIAHIGPRLVDPAAHSTEIVGIFRYSEDKARVEEILKSRTTTLNASLFKQTAASLSTGSEKRGGNGGGVGGGGGGSGRGGAGRGAGLGRGAGGRTAPSSSIATAKDATEGITTVSNTGNTSNNLNVRKDGLSSSKPFSAGISSARPKTVETSGTIAQNKIVQRTSSNHNVVLPEESPEQSSSAEGKTTKIEIKSEKVKSKSGTNTNNSGGDSSAQPSTTNKSIGKASTAAAAITSSAAKGITVGPTVNVASAPSAPVSPRKALFLASSLSEGNNTTLQSESSYVDTRTSSSGEIPVWEMRLLLCRSLSVHGVDLVDSDDDDATDDEEGRTEVEESTEDDFSSVEARTTALNAPKQQPQQQQRKVREEVMGLSIGAPQSNIPHAIRALFPQEIATVETGIVSPVSTSTLTLSAASSSVATPSKTPVPSPSLRRNSSYHGGHTPKYTQLDVCNDGASFHTPVQTRSPQLVRRASEWNCTRTHSFSELELSSVKVSDLTKLFGASALTTTAPLPNQASSPRSKQQGFGSLNYCHISTSVSSSSSSRSIDIFEVNAATAAEDLLAIDEHGFEVFSYRELLRRNVTKDYRGLPQGQLERHLEKQQFYEKFGVSKEEFSKLAKWRQTAMKKELGLF